MAGWRGRQTWVCPVGCCYRGIGKGFSDTRFGGPVTGVFADCVFGAICGGYRGKGNRVNGLMSVGQGPWIVARRQTQRGRHLRQFTAHHFGKRLYQLRHNSRGLDAPKLNARLFGLLPCRDVDVVEDFQVVGEKLHRDDQRMPVARLSECGEQFLDVGAQPFLGGVACALVGELPADGGGRPTRWATASAV